MLACYNEELNITGYLDMVNPYVDHIIICDDQSTDSTLEKMDTWQLVNGWRATLLTIGEHTGLPETVKKFALGYVDDGAWVLALDADEVISAQELQKIRDWVDTNPTQTHMYFSLKEFIDGVPAREFAKCRLYRKEAVIFSPRIHEDETFLGEGINIGLTVIHSKSSQKQISRERAYIETYKKLLSEGKITEDRYQTMLSYHYFIKE
jgi:glycosyltransferase involved in cell wall biosynthesis